mmetsp:Transcript_34271/g.58677  ORF Transcript_34271/g.58677 Transcript_34271/m.58677 type:complete len:441 (+) Transcript_34271:28-1350(+)
MWALSALSTAFTVPPNSLGRCPAAGSDWISAGHKRAPAADLVKMQFPADRDARNLPYPPEVSMSGARDAAARRNSRYFEYDPRYGRFDPRMGPGMGGPGMGPGMGMRGPPMGPGMEFQPPVQPPLRNVRDANARAEAREPWMYQQDRQWQRGGPGGPQPYPNQPGDDPRRQQQGRPQKPPNRLYENNASPDNMGHPLAPPQRPPGQRQPANGPGAQQPPPDPRRQGPGGRPGLPNPYDDMPPGMASPPALPPNVGQNGEIPREVMKGQVGSWFFGPYVTPDERSVCVGFAGSVASQIQPKLFSTPEDGIDSAVQLEVYPNYHETVAYLNEFDPKADLSALEPEKLKVWAQRAQQRLTGTSLEASPRQILACPLSASDAGQWMVSKAEEHEFCGGSFTSELIKLGMAVVDTPTRSNHMLPNGVNFIVLKWPIKMAGPDQLI